MVEFVGALSEFGASLCLMCSLYIHYRTVKANEKIAEHAAEIARAEALRRN